MSAVTQSDYNRIVNALEMRTARDMNLTPTTLSDLPADATGYIFRDYDMRPITRRMDGWCLFAGNSPEGERFYFARPGDLVWVSR